MKSILGWVAWTLFLPGMSAAAMGTGPYFNILEYGAHPNDTARSTAAFQRAIQAAHDAGGGTVYVPAGRYECGPIRLVSNLVLYIEAGATLHFPAERLPYVWTRNQGIECLAPVPLIWGKDLENVTIAGRGTLTTSNADWLTLMPRLPGSAAGPQWERLLESLERKTPAAREEYERAAPELRPAFIQFMGCANVKVEGIRIVGSPMWPIHLLYSENAVVSDVLVETYPGVHTGGIYIDSSTDVRISGCFIDTGDDGIVLKSGKDADGLRVNRPTENVSITNCTVRRAHGAVVLGSEIAGGLRNIVAGDITCRGTRIGIRIKSRRGRGGFIENARFDNWTMDSVGQAVSVTNYYVMEGERRTAEEPVSNRTPVFRDIAISNISVEHARVAINIDGLPEMPIEGLVISNVIAGARIGVKASRTRDLELHNVCVEASSGPAFLARYCRDLDLDGVSTRAPAAGMPVIRLDSCRAIVVRGCRAYDGTGTFLSTGMGGLKEVDLEGNWLERARTASEESTGSYWQAVEPATEE